MRNAWICLASGLALAASGASAASFDCTKAKHPLEKLICSDPQLSRADEDLGEAYKARLAIVFDKAAFRAQQQDWLKILRTRCAASCVRADVAAEYAAQLSLIRKLNEESWSANYKSGDEADLTLRHDGSGFSFAITRASLDNSDDMFCALPKKGEAEPVARASADAHAAWQSRDGSCKVDFTLMRDKTGSVTDIKVSSRGCARACKQGYMLDDNYQPANNWIAGNQ
jgi:uncharacterized protein YecT (DUF1311 family)